MENIVIRKISETDLTKLQIIGRQTFFETFGDQNNPGDMQAYLDKSFSHDKLKEELNEPDSEFYFASQNREVIGYLKVNFGAAQTELKNHNSVEIERIYVLRSFHGKKAGQVLYNKALAIAKQKKADFIWLGVWEKNPRAIQFYKKNGFVEFDKHVFKLGKDEQTDILMRLIVNEHNSPD